MLPATIAYNDAILEAAKLYKLDPNLIRAIIRAESQFDPLAVSRAGAKGLMQLMPALAKELDVLDPFDPRQNIFGGARYLRQLLDLNNGNSILRWRATTRGPVRSIGKRHSAVPRDPCLREEGQSVPEERQAKFRRLTSYGMPALISQYVTAPIPAAAGIVITHAQTIWRATPHRTAERRRVAPTPTIAPVIVCVVLMPTPSIVAM